MKRLVPTTAMLLAAFCASAQRPVALKHETKPAAAKKVPEAAVFLASSMLSGGSISDRVFDSLARQSIIARDHSGGAARVLGFTVTFAERTLAEDSAGNPITAVDFFSERCTGDTLNAVLQANLFDRTKPGDTVWYDHIRVATAAGETAGKAMKFVIVR